MDFSEKVATNYLKLVNLSQYTSLVKGKKPNFFKLMLYDYLLIYSVLLNQYFTILLPIFQMFMEFILFFL